jgi:double-stranded uracil-DNA glycosylase
MSKAAKCFPPVIDTGIETLILGSFPSRKSLQKAEYYAHKQNQFWRLVGAVIAEDMPREMDYAQRKRILLKHHIGLWDVIGACEREGSLDSNIRNQRDNDFSPVLSKAKKLHRIFFNGKKAAEKEPIFKLRYETVVLPSSSPANTMRFDAKLEQWRQVALHPARKTC